MCVQVSFPPNFVPSTSALSIFLTSFLTYLSVSSVQPALSSVQFHLLALQSLNCKKKVKGKNYFHASSPCQNFYHQGRLIKISGIVPFTFNCMNLNILKCLLISINYRWLKTVSRTSQDLVFDGSLEALFVRVEAYMGYIGMCDSKECGF